jgi:hypothetical protein
MAAKARFMCVCVGREADAAADQRRGKRRDHVMVLIGHPIRCVMIALFAGAEGGIAMAKGQMRSTKEKKKPKADWNKKKKGGPAPAPAGAPSQPMPGSPFGKKS